MVVEIVELETEVVSILIIQCFGFDATGTGESFLTGLGTMFNLTPPGTGFSFFGFFGFGPV